MFLKGQMLVCIFQHHGSHMGYKLMIVINSVTINSVTINSDYVVTKSINSDDQ